MPSTSFDALAAARELKAAGVSDHQAEVIAAQLRTAAGADHDTLATKADLDALRTAVRSDIGALRTELRIVGALVLLMAGKLFGIFDAVAASL